MPRRDIGHADDACRTSGTAAHRPWRHLGPDYLANAGGLIQAAVEIAGRDAAEARRDVEAIYDTTQRIITHAAAHNITTRRQPTISHCNASAPSRRRGPESSGHQSLKRCVSGQKAEADMT